MNPAELRIASLEQKISEATDAYYNDEAIITDEEFDALKDELLDLDPDSPALFAVGAPLPGKEHWEKLAHSIPMGSQDKVNTIAQLHDWVNAKSSVSDLVDGLCCQEKLDGISLSLNYLNGELVSAVTRGDGIRGENIYKNAVKMQGVPKQLVNRPDYSGSVRGEVLMFKEAWEKHFSDKSNPRNAASGISRRLTEGGQEHLTVVAYDMTNLSPDIWKESSKLESLKAMGFTIPKYVVGDVSVIDKRYQDYESGERESLPYEIDGLVIKVNNLEEQMELGHHSDDVTRNPRGQIALKFAHEMRESVINDVTWEVGLTGRLTPLAHITPVQIAGVMVSKASLATAKRVKELGIWVGCRALVSRRGDVIPYVEKVLDFSAPDIFPPTECPKCKTSVEWHGEYLQCVNDECRVSGNVQKWVNLLDMDGIGPKVIEALVDSGLVLTAADLYRLTPRKVETLDRMGKRSSEKVVEAIQDKKTTTFYTFMAGLNIPGCGPKVFKNFVAQGYDTVDKLLALSQDEMESVPGIGEGKSKDVYVGIRKRSALIEDLFDAGVSILESVSAGSSKLSGKSFCFTGKMDMPRGELEKIAEFNGANIRSVSKKLTHLVIADPNSSSSKAIKARKLGVQLISEQDFMAMTK